MEILNFPYLGTSAEPKPLKLKKLDISRNRRIPVDSLLALLEAVGDTLEELNLRFCSLPFMDILSLYLGNASSARKPMRNLKLDNLIRENPSTELPQLEKIKATRSIPTMKSLCLNRIHLSVLLPLSDF